MNLCDICNDTICLCNMKCICNTCNKKFKREYFPNIEKYGVEYNCPLDNCIGKVIPFGIKQVVYVTVKNNYKPPVEDLNEIWKKCGWI